MNSRRTCFHSASTGLLGISHKRSKASHSRAGLFASVLQILHAFAQAMVYNDIIGDVSVKPTLSYIREQRWKSQHEQ